MALPLNGKEERGGRKGVRGALLENGCSARHAVSRRAYKIQRVRDTADEVDKGRFENSVRKCNVADGHVPSATMSSAPTSPGTSVSFFRNPSVAPSGLAPWSSLASSYLFALSDFRSEDHAGLRPLHTCSDI